jgi:hypothetical protein
LLDRRIYEPFMNEGSVAIRTIDAMFITTLGKKTSINFREYIEKRMLDVREDEVSERDYE